MDTAPAREPHLVRFRVHAEEAVDTPDVPPFAEGAREAPLELIRPAPPSDRPPWLDRLERWRDDPRARLVVIALVALAAGLYWYRSALGGEATPVEDTTPVTDADVATSHGPASEEIVIHVSGGVTRPGLLHLEAGARVADAIEAAGGAVAEADLDQLNLAAPLGDGERVHVPLHGEVLPLVPGSAATGPVNVNTASAAQLESLPGVGPTIAEAIVAARAEHRFQTVDDLLRVRGIGPSRLEELRPLITV